MTNNVKKIKIKIKIKWIFIIPIKKLNIILNKKWQKKKKKKRQLTNNNNNNNNNNNLCIYINIKGYIIPQMSEDVLISFTPDQWKYYYDTIKIMGPDINVTVPIHG